MEIRIIKSKIIKSMALTSLTLLAFSQTTGQPTAGQSASRNPGRFSRQSGRLSVGQTGDQRVGQIPATNAEYAAKMSASLQQVEETLGKRPQHAVAYGANLICAQGALVRSVPIEDILGVVDALAAAGVKRIDMNIAVSFWSGSGNPAVVQKYKQIAQHIHAKGMRLALNPLNQGTIAPAANFADYQQQCVLVYPKIVSDLQPDIFVVVHEPSSMARYLHITGTPAQWAAFAQATAEAVRGVSPHLRVGAGGLSVDKATLEALMKVPQLDLLTLDIYSLRSLREDYTLATEAKQAGKSVYIEETWRPSVEINNGIHQVPGAQIGCADFEPLDCQWLETMSVFARVSPFDEITYFWSSCFFLYEPGPTSGTQAAYQAAAAQAAAHGRRTKTYQALQRVCSGQKP